MGISLVWVTFIVLFGLFTLKL